MPQARSETIGCKYIVQYIFAAGATAAVEPLIGVIGVGWTFTICELPLSVLRKQVLKSDYLTRRFLCHHWRFPCSHHHQMGH